MEKPDLLLRILGGWDESPAGAEPFKRRTLPPRPTPCGRGAFLATQAMDDPAFPLVNI